MSNKQTSPNGVGFGGLLSLVFIVLKLCKVITWSWWWVLCPFWLPLAIILLVLIVTFIIEFRKI